MSAAPAPPPLDGGGPTFRQTLVEALRGVRLTSQRTLLTMLGLAVGSATITALLHIGQGAQAGALRAFETMGARLLMASFPAPPGSRRTPATLDVEAVTSALPALARVAPIGLHGARIAYRGHGADANIVGSTAALAQVFALHLRVGRFVGAGERREPVVVLGTRMARALGADAATVLRGDTVRIENYGYTVIGILDGTPANPLFPVALDDAAIIPQGAMRRLQPVPQLSGIVFEAAGDGDSAALASMLLSHFGRLWPGVAMEIREPRQLIEGMRAQSRMFAHLLAALGGIALLVSGIGVMNVMLMSVAERRREIGVRLALGARGRDIRNLFLLEAFGLSGVGALAGGTIGLLVSYGYARYADWPFQPDPEALALGLASPLVVGLVFGLYPAWSAARLQPLQVLRDE